MEFNIKNLRKIKESQEHNKNRSHLKTNVKMKSRNVQLPIVLSISIQNASKATLEKSILNILTQIRYILDALCIIVTNVELVETQCRFYNAFVAPKRSILDVWTNKKYWNSQKNNSYVIIILKIKKIWKRHLRDLTWHL